MPSWHRNCRGKSIGRVLHFLYHYCGFNIAEHAIIGNGKVYYPGEHPDNVIATYEWLSDTDIPHFTFQVSRNNILFRENPSSLWQKNQQEKLVEAIKDADDTEGCPKCDKTIRDLKFEVSSKEWLYQSTSDSIISAKMSKGIEPNDEGVGRMKWVIKSIRKFFPKVFEEALSESQ